MIQVRIKKKDYYDIAYCDIDVSNLDTSPQLRIDSIKWASKLIVKGGYILTNNTWAFKKHSNFDVEKFMIQKNFKIIQLDKYKNRNWAKTFNENTIWNTKSAMLCKKLQLIIQDFYYKYVFGLIIKLIIIRIKI